jgi:hypothetical protein
MIKYSLKLENKKGLRNTIKSLQNGIIKMEGINLSILYTKYNDTLLTECILLNNKKSNIDKIKYIIIGIDSALKTYTRLFLIDDSGQIIKTLVG